MIICSASRRYLLLAGTIGTLAVAVWPAAAQQTPARIGGPSAMGAGSIRDGNWGQARADRAATPANGSRPITDREAESAQGL